MKERDWNDLSKLGLLKRINHEMLHPLGLAISRNPKTGVSEKILVADDGIWEYENKDILVLSKSEIADAIRDL